MLPSDSCEVGAQKDHMPQPRAPEAAKPKESETDSSLYLLPGGGDVGSAAAHIHQRLALPRTGRSRRLASA